jgi:hypothetical protein
VKLLALAAGLVLLCYEPVGEPCHRHLFSRWLEEKTGQHVPELLSPQASLLVVQPSEEEGGGRSDAS